MGDITSALLGIFGTAVGASLPLLYQWLDRSRQLRLERLKLEHEVRFRHAEEAVAKHLTAVYQHLFRFNKQVASLVRVIESTSEPTKKDKYDATSKANDEFWEYLLLNRPHIPPKLYEKIREVANKLADITIEFGNGLRREERGIPADHDDHYWLNAHKAVDEEAGPLLSAVVRDIQKRLGVEDME